MWKVNKVVLLEEMQVKKRRVPGGEFVCNSLKQTGRTEEIYSENMRMILGNYK